MSKKHPLSWAPSTIGSLPINYEPQYQIAGTSSWTNAITVSPFTTPAITVTIGGLQPSTIYNFRVLSVNSTSTTASGSVSATTLAQLPSAPTGLAVVTTPGVSDIILQWNAPTTGTGPFQYQLYSRTPAGSGAYIAIGSPIGTTTFDVTGLTPGTSYDFEVGAINAAGQGPLSNPLLAVTTSSAVLSVPSSPTNLVATLTTSNSVTLGWTPPATGTTPFQYYVQYRLH